MRRLWQTSLLTILVLVATWGCDEAGVLTPRGSGVPGSELSFLSPSEQAPPLLDPDTTVVATAGQDLRVEFFYEDPGNPGQRGDRFLRFELDPGSLERYPDDHPRAGALFQPGDTVHISIQASGDTLLAELEPAGLRFDPDEPAELELSYAVLNDDFDGDGQPDPDLEDDLDLWRQETSGEPWFKIGEVKDFELDEIKATLTSFTRYALAF